MCYLLLLGGALVLISTVCGLGFDISCKISPEETICMKCQSLFSGKNKIDFVCLWSAELTQRLAMVKWITEKF